MATLLRKDVALKSVRFQDYFRTQLSLATNDRILGDSIVAVSGKGFRRFAPDFDESELENLSQETHTPNDNHVLHLGKGEAYSALLARIKAVKAAGSPPLTLSLERYGWDAKVNSWPRFLEARDGNVPAAMKMLQEHENWKNEIFPIDLTRDGIQEVLRLKAVAEIDVQSDDSIPPTVYVNFSKLQAVESISTDDVCKAFIIFTEMMLARSKDPRNPKACQCKSCILHVDMQFHFIDQIFQLTSRLQRS